MFKYLNFTTCEKALLKDIYNSFFIAVQYIRNNIYIYILKFMKNIFTSFLISNCHLKNFTNLRKSFAKISFNNES